MGISMLTQLMEHRMVELRIAILAWLRKLNRILQFRAFS